MITQLNKFTKTHPSVKERKLLACYWALVGMEHLTMTSSGHVASTAHGELDSFRPSKAAAATHHKMEVEHLGLSTTRHT